MSDVRQVPGNESFRAIPLEAPEKGLRLMGELDLATVKSFEQALASLDGGGQTTLDLAELTFIDSVGLHAIVSYARSFNGDGPVILTNASPATRRAFEVASLDAYPALDLR